MGNTRDIRRRIKSIKNTIQVTKAMQMIATSKMKKAELMVKRHTEYLNGFKKIVTTLAKNFSSDDLSCLPDLMKKNSSKEQLIVLITTNKGLCGGLNTNILKEATPFSKNSFVTIGKKGFLFLQRIRATIEADYSFSDFPSQANIFELSSFLIEQFLSEKFGSISILYSHCVNMLTQKPTLLHLLPFSLQNLSIQDVGTEDYSWKYIFEPDEKYVLENTLPSFFNTLIFHSLLDSIYSEQSARIVAMKNATDNARSLEKDLTLEYNKARQSSITTELLEISTAQLALS